MKKISNAEKRRIKEREKRKRWRLAHMEEYKATLEEYKAKKAPYEEVADEPEKNYKTLEELYCANYKKDQLGCIQCYENQTACYKGCYRSGK